MSKKQRIDERKKKVRNERNEEAEGEQERERSTLTIQKKSAELAEEIA